MHNNSNYDRQLELITSENINVGTTSDLKDFFVLVGGILGAILIFLLSYNYISAFFIDRMSTETQLRIESIFKTEDKKVTQDKYKKQILLLENIKKEIVENDISIQGKAKLDINVIQNKEINAMIKPDGSIYFTSKLLDENLPEQELAFILAHEIGHYSNKDHLKSLSKQVAFAIVCLLAGMDNEVSSIVKNVSEIEFLSHSRIQEKKADLYANKMLIKIYGTNDGAKALLKRLKEKRDFPEFLHYFSSHPSWDERLYLIENN